MSTTQRSSWWLTTSCLVVLLVLQPKSVISQSRDNNNNTNDPLIRLVCAYNPPISRSSFSSNLNSTIAELRSKISIKGVYYAEGQSLENGDSVYGAFQCMYYLSTSQCVACFDAAASELGPCTAVNGASVFLDNCYLSYVENQEDMAVGPLGICGNQSASQPTIFSQIVQGLLSDLQKATPRTSNFYVASTRQVSGTNATVYAIAQCIETTNEAACKNCVNTGYNNLYSCLPSSEGRSVDPGCFMRYSDTPFFSDSQKTDMSPFLGEGRSSKVGIIAGAVAGAVFFMIVLVSSLWYRRRKKSKAAKEERPELKGAVNYSYKDLQLSTNNFSEENRIGKGGFAEVFKAILDDDNVVAVKKLHVGRYGRAKIEFENEVKLISNIHHRNLIRLQGWCSEGPELLLVLEYMPKGSLDKYLWGAKKGSLNWKQRFDIIFGIARGLAHLHDEFHVKIIHRDIKSSNILLDGDFQPKIADFGLARFQPGDRSHVSTKFAGTLGYTAPEYAIHGQLSEKADTYSFGVVVLEIISGRRCTRWNSDGPYADSLLEHAWNLYEKDVHMMLIDETLDPSEYEEEHVTKIIEIALMCAQSPVSLRPTMSEVVVMLSSGRSLERKQLTRPFFIDNERRIHVGAFPGATGRSKIPEKFKEFDLKEVENEEDCKVVHVIKDEMSY